jgi:hypothetical protein
MLREFIIGNLFVRLRASRFQVSSNCDEIWDPVVLRANSCRWLIEAASGSLCMTVSSCHVNVAFILLLEQDPLLTGY